MMIRRGNEEIDTCRNEFGRGKTLFVSDLDGTLMQPDATLSARTVELLNESIKEGKLFTVATARTPATVSGIIADVEMQLPSIVMTGAAIWDKRTNSYSNRKFIDPAAVKEFIEVLHKNEFPIFHFTLEDDIINIYHVGGNLNEIEREFEEERINSPYKRFHLREDGGEIIPEKIENTILFYGMQPTAHSEQVYLQSKEIANLRPQFYHDIYGPTIGIMEAFSPLATKAEAIKMMKKITGAEKVVAFGDNINDIPMFEVADVAVAVDNALPEVKEKADVIIGPNTSDSVAQFIHDFSE